MVTKSEFDDNILIVDDDDDIRYAIAKILKKCGCKVTEAASIENSFEQLNAKQFDMIFCDLRFKGALGGEDLLKHVSKSYPDIDVVLISSLMDQVQQEALLQKGAAYCLQKPFFKDECLKVLGKLTHNRNIAT